MFLSHFMDVTFDPPIPPFDLGDDTIPQFPCTYKSFVAFKNSLINYKEGAFSLMSVNVRSCRKNFASFV